MLRSTKDGIITNFKMMMSLDLIMSYQSIDTIDFITHRMADVTKSEKSISLEQLVLIARKKATVVVLQSKEITSLNRTYRPLVVLQLTMKFLRRHT